MDEYEVRQTASATADVAGIIHYISAKLCAPDTALKMLDSIEEALEKL